MRYLHFDEAKHAALQALQKWLADTDVVERALLVRDLFGRFRLALWGADKVNEQALTDTLAQACGSWWTGEIKSMHRDDKVTRRLYDEVAAQAQPVAGAPRLLVLERHRTRTGWFADEDAPLWAAPESGPPIVVFYSFKGGLGRSTCLASFAIQRARTGERVVVLDLDLDSPGIGRVLASDPQGLTSSWGVVDFLVEQAPAEAPLADYFHRCDRVAGSGELIVFPAGRVDEAYADKLARVDMEGAETAAKSALGTLLARVRGDLKPQWILLDARTGLSDSAGRLLSGFAHLHVLLGTTQDQSWQGLNRVLDRLGKDRVERGLPQHEVVLVQAMVPVGAEAGRLAREAFAARAEREFVDRYYACEDLDGESADSLWTVGDLEGRSAPHVPVPIDYEQKLADFADIADVAELLCGGPYAELGVRIAERYATEADT
jgi:MinD-like ATPase involved in chromosome partitioning or flagellar assembly